MIEALVITSRLLLSSVFLYASIAKIADSQDLPDLFTESGLIPSFVSRLAGKGLPIIELAVGMGLLIDRTADASVAAAQALLVLFTIYLVWKIRKGQEDGCNCFGSKSKSVPTSSAIARNGLLLAATIPLGIFGTGSFSAPTTSWLASLEAIEVVILTSIGALGVSTALQWWLLLELLRQFERLNRWRLEGQSSDREVTLSIADRLPEMQLIDSNVGGETSLAQALAPERSTFVAFVSSECAPCSEFVDYLANTRARGTAVVETVANTIVIDVDQATTDMASLAGVRRFHFKSGDADDAIERLGLASTPSALVVASSGELESPLVSGLGAVRVLYRSFSMESAPDKG